MDLAPDAPFGSTMLAGVPLAFALDFDTQVSDRRTDRTDLVVICGRDLVDDKYFPMINTAGDKASEQESRDRILRSEKQIGGLPAKRLEAIGINDGHRVGYLYFAVQGTRLVGTVNVRGPYRPEQDGHAQLALWLAAYRARLGL